MISNPRPRFAKLIMTVAMFALIAGLLGAQVYRGTGRTPSRFNPLIAQLKVGSVIDELNDINGNGAYDNWCTSYLQNDGPKPEKTPDMNADNPYQYFLDVWSCKFSPEHAQDGDVNTVWSEGAKGPGIGEALIVRIDLHRPAQIWTGFGKTQELFKANGRPHQIQITVLWADRVIRTQNGTSYKAVKAISQMQYELQDVNAYQPLPLPRIADYDNSQYFIAVKILSVYPGSTYEDTCITEINNP